MARADTIGSRKGGRLGATEPLDETDVVGDERDVDQADLAGEVGEELEWRMGEAGPEPGAA